MKVCHLCENHQNAMSCCGVIKFEIGQPPCPLLPPPPPLLVDGTLPNSYKRWVSVSCLTIPRITTLRSIEKERQAILCVFDKNVKSTFWYIDTYKTLPDRGINLKMLQFRQESMMNIPCKFGQNPFSGLS